MKIIELTNDKIALVDDEDYKYLNSFNWYCGNGKYARRFFERKEGSRNCVELLMHRVILKINDPAIEVDHIDRNGLNNQKHNLRKCIHRQNSYNMSLRKDNTSGYKGVYFVDGKWRAYITFNEKRINLGRYVNKEEAAKAYDKAALQLFGEFACVNGSRPVSK